MELEDITDTTDVEQLIEQYIEVALTSEHAFQISPIPEQFVCTTVFPPEAKLTVRLAQFVRDYRMAVTSRWDRVIKFQSMLQRSQQNPVLLSHPLSSQLCIRVGHGFACVDIATRHLNAITARMKRLGAHFDGSPQADPLPASRENTVTPFKHTKKGSS